MTMIERVARAIQESDLPVGPIRVEDLKRDGYFDMARAAIAAMREPTKDMEARAAGYFDLDIWQAMIDAALEEK